MWWCSIVSIARTVMECHSMLRHLPPKFSSLSLAIFSSFRFLQQQPHDTKMFCCVFLVYYPYINPIPRSHPTPMLHTFTVCCKCPDCPLNVFFYITLHFSPFLFLRTRLFSILGGKMWHMYIYICANGGNIHKLCYRFFLNLI